MAALSEQPLLPSERDSSLAETSRQLLSKYGKKDMKLKIEGKEDTLTLPASVVRLLQRILDEMAEGNAVTLVSLEAELSTQQAAEVLNVSRPFVVKLLDDAELPHRMVGTHRRVLLKDVLKYKEKMHRQSREALQDLAKVSQDMGLY